MRQTFFHTFLSFPLCFSLVLFYTLKTFTKFINFSILTRSLDIIIKLIGFKLVHIYFFIILLLAF